MERLTVEKEISLIIGIGWEKEEVGVVEIEEIEIVGVGLSWEKEETDVGGYGWEAIVII